MGSFFGRFLVLSVRSSNSCHVVSSHRITRKHGATRYTSVASLETLGLAYKQATELVGHYYDAFHNETKLATDPSALAKEKAGVEALEKDLLIKKMAQPLSEPTFTIFLFHCFDFYNAGAQQKTAGTMCM